MKIWPSIRHNLQNLLTFRGRQSPGQFWPFAIAVFMLTTAVGMLALIPEFLTTFARMQQFAADHPEQARVESGPGYYSIQIEGHHPELMPDFDRFIGIVVTVAIVTILMLAAAVARRLHDSGKSALWGLMPIPFLAIGLSLFPSLFGEAQPDLRWCGLLFLNNVVYLITLAALIVLLVAQSSPAENRFGPSPIA